MAAVAGTMLFALATAIAGPLRPGYSALHQPLSDLGVGSHAWLLNIPMAVLGLSLVALAIGFAHVMRAEMVAAWRWICGLLMALPGSGSIIAAIFTEAPSTLTGHIAGAVLFFYLPVITFLVLGLQLRRICAWRTYGVYSLVASSATIIVLAFLTMATTPSSALAGLRLSGLAERLALVDVLVWYVIVGWRLYSLPNGSNE